MRPHPTTQSPRRGDPGRPVHAAASLRRFATCCRARHRPVPHSNPRRRHRRRPVRRADRRDRPSTRRSRRSTTCRIPTRRFATSARCPTTASGDRSAPCTSTPTASTSGPAIAAAPTPASDRMSIRWSSSIRTARWWRASAPGQILWPHGMDVDKQGNIWVADARSATPQEIAKFPECEGQGPHRAEVFAARQTADDARHAG